MELIKAVIVLADIGGYTKFITMHEASLLHAERIITDLLESVIAGAEYPLTLNKLEGDAALFYAPATCDPAAVLRSAFQQAQGFFRAFHVKRDELDKVQACPCEACTHVGELRIKAIVHYGEVAVKQVRQFEELAGTPVIVAHRLLKNTVARDEYILATEAFATAAGGLPEPASRHVEQCEGVGAVPVVVYDAPKEDALPVYNTNLARKVRRRFWILGYQVLRSWGLVKGRQFKNLAGA